MAKTNKYKIQQWGTALILGLFSILLLYLNILSPLMPGDDYLYSLKIPEDHYLGDRPIQGLSDYFESQINHFKNYNYRIIPHAVLQLLLLLPQWIFDFLNTIIFLIIPIVLLKGRKISRQDFPIWYLIVLLFIWVFHFDLGRSYFWTTGSLNYSWTLVIQLLYVHVLLGYIPDDYNRSSKSIWILALLISMTNEQVVLSLFIVTALITLHRFRTNREIIFPLLISSTILLLGGLIMYYSPAMSFRLNREGFAYETELDRWSEYFRRVIYYIIRYSPVLVLLFVQGYKNVKSNSKVKYLLAICILSMLTMSQAPLFEPRSAIFGFAIFLMAGIQMINLDRPKPILIVPLLIISGFLFIERIPLFKEIANKHQANIQELEKNRGSEGVVYLDRFCASYKYQCLICDDITDDPKYMDNEPIAAFYDINELVLKPETSLKYQSAKTRNDFKSGNNVDYLQARKSDSLLDDGIELLDCHYNNRLPLNMALELNSNADLQDHIVILRGSRKGINRYRLYDLIPLKWRVYFLDYLEYNAPLDNLEGRYFAFHTVFEPDEYAYYLISLYNLNNHAPVGETIRIELANESD